MDAGSVAAEGADDTTSVLSTQTDDLAKVGGLLCLGQKKAGHRRAGDGATALGRRAFAARGRSLFAEPRCSGNLAMSD